MLNDVSCGAGGMTASAAGELAVSVVVPVYNSEGSLQTLVERIRAVLQRAVGRFEVLLIDDCSHDRSWEIIESLAAEHAFVRGFRMMRNYGQHNALLCGIREARYGLIATLDDDLQNPPEELPRLLVALGHDYDVVYGVPEREAHGLLRDIASQMTKIALQKAMGAEMARNVSAFRVFRTGLRGAFDGYRGPHVSIDVLLTWGTRRFTMIRVAHQPRAVGKSNYTMGKLIAHATNMVTGYTTIPLRLASVIGLVFTFLGFLALSYVVGRYLIQGSPVPGFPFLASMVAVFSGAQLFALGIIGEYLARIHLRTMDQPSYAIRSTTVERLAADLSVADGGGSHPASRV